MDVGAARVTSHHDVIDIARRHPMRARDGLGLKKVPALLRGLLLGGLLRAGAPSCSHFLLVVDVADHARVHLDGSCLLLLLLEGGGVLDLMMRGHLLVLAGKGGERCLVLLLLLSGGGEDIVDWGHAYTRLPRRASPLLIRLLLLAL